MSRSGEPIEGMRGHLLRVSFGLGGASLMLAMIVDFVGVLARHVGVQFLGGIEIVQLCIVGAISSALIVATATGSHAAVHLLTTRLGGIWKTGLERVSDTIASLLFLALAAGSGWILAELAPKHEQGDLLHLPIAPARALWMLSLVLAAALEAFAAVRPTTSASAISATSLYEP